MVGSLALLLSNGLIYRRISKEVLGKSKASCSIQQLQEEQGQQQLTESDTAKLIFFENLFYMLDSDSNCLIGIEDAAVMLSFVSLRTSRLELEKIPVDHFSEHHRLNCADFVELCVEIMWTMPFEEIRMGAQNYNSSYMRFTKLCANYWLGWSKAVDRWSRFWLPLCFTIALGILFNLELVDDYAGSAEAEMFQGFGPSYMSVAGVFRSLIMPFFAVICICAWFYMRKQARKPKIVREVAPEPDMKPIVPRWSVRQNPVDMDAVDSE